MRAMADGRSSPRDELGDHRVVVDRDVETGLRPAVVRGCRDPTAPQIENAAWRGKKSVVRILGVDAALDGVSVRTSSRAGSSVSRSPFAMASCQRTSRRR